MIAAPGTGEPAARGPDLSHDPAPPDQAVALGAAAVAGTVTATIPLTFPPDGGPTPLDQRVEDPISAALDSRPWIAEVLALPSNTWVVISLMLAGAAWFGWQHRWWCATAMVVVPEVAAGLNTWALKPFWGRPLHDYLAYPSGHTVHLVAVATTFVVLIESTRARLVIACCTVAAWICAAVGMIALDYHHATDIIGGAGAAIALSVLLCAAGGQVRQRMAGAD
ncbi:phosphatase PAP2 family protein [Nocardia cyriacigeorgica]|uniref:Phosphatase PAP2 family protein n=1 Tax=Nocardia cyriacigeorgica TaxID=135487 RepID=A0A6P1DAQ7_9NOCA|nr:phosphatase PAP2 family protein [Nocardia cyriacigeorgica]NEW38054.1 phosphatase PAP2 family protein [Nocardia cyriacigeorgica]NEW45392.1 phosphatase PAP2 family protein [Nocardia cyriacigeorgica]NEW48563.1 phosphatase PAP2 family protein [Nocardia cyriacigeorgica]NEW57923.1 phosphatase PAP2 family protein [Nocardia cyriacigeorgica]